MTIHIVIIYVLEVIEGYCIARLWMNRLDNPITPMFGKDADVLLRGIATTGEGGIADA